MTNRTQAVTEAMRVMLADAAGALGLPPASFGLLPDSWNQVASSTPELELEIWAPAALALTNAVLYGAALHPLVYADQTVTMSASTNKITKAGHNLQTGDGPFTFSNVGGVLGGGIDSTNGYWFIRDDANTGHLAQSLNDALAGNSIDITADSTGTSTIHDGADTSRVYWETHDGLLGLLGDGAVSLDVQVGYRKRLPHSPRVFAYALVGDIDTGTLSAAIYPIQGR